MFTLDELRKATGHFRPYMRLGKGGFGRVYEGWVHEKTYVPSKFGVGMAIAVKTKSMQRFEEWKREIKFLGNYSHPNLVKLLGYCQDDKELLLVYEYMQKGSLDKHLYNSVKSSYLDWERRYKIIGGVARGLLYLHEDSRLQVIHRNLKASNVLLDAEMNPKIANLSMARLFNIDETQGNTTRIVGTYGYMAPECAMHGEFSVKSDVFSFGILVLEIVSGQKNNFFRNGEIKEDLASYALKNWRAGGASNVMDPTLNSSSGSLGEMMRCIHIGLLCVQENAADGPAMASVALMFNSFSLTLALPSEPGFFMRSSIDPEKEESAIFSLYEDSATDLYPR